MDGFIIEIKVDNSEDNKPLYWNGNYFDEKIESSHFFTSIIEARQLVGSLQSQYTDRTFVIMPAKNGVHLV